MGKKRSKKIEKLSIGLTEWIGTPASVVFHTIFFVAIFALYFLGFTTDEILLILTTAVSLEAIYLAIFIQMTVNRNTKSLEAVEEDIEDIAEEVEDISEDIDEDDVEDKETKATLTKINSDLKKLHEDLNRLMTQK